MIVLIGIILGIEIFFLLWRSFIKEKDFFHPRTMFLFLEFIKYVPGLILLNEESSVIFTTEGALFIILFESLYILAALISMNLIKTKGITKNYAQLNIPLIIIIGSFLIGIWAKFQVINEMGGILFVLLNGQMAYQMQQHGFGVYIMLYKFMFVSILAICDLCLIKKLKKYYITAIVLIITYMLSFLIYTSRTPGLIVMLILLFVYNYEVKTIKFRNLTNKWIILTFFLLFSASYYAGSQRTNLTNTVEESSFYDMVRNLCNDGRDMFVYNYFSENTKWYGRGYLNIIPSLIPGVEDKPSTDDGLYLVNLLRGHDVDITDNYNTLPSETGSVPFSTPAYMFANFGGLGVILGGFIMGLILMWTYKYMIRNINSFNVAIYFYIIYSFGLSTGRMVPTLISIFIIYLFSFTMKKMGFAYKNNEKRRI